MLKRKKLPSQKDLISLFEYSPSDPQNPLVYKTKGKYSHNIKIGDRAGGKHTANGYSRIKINGILYWLHRVVFMFHRGYCPDQIDHADCDKSNNLIENLREATHTQNAHSMGRTVRNKSGYKGVNWNKSSNKYAASIRFNGKLKHIGYFDCPKRAHEAYKEKAIELYGEFAHW